MAKSNTLDLTKGDIFSRLVVFAIPILVGQLFQTLYNSVDSIVVGNFVGTNALAAVTASSPIANFLVGFFVGMSTGASVLFGRHFGGRSYAALDEAIHTTVAFSALLGSVVAALGIIFTPQLLTLASCPADVFEDAKIYLRIYLVGVLFLSMYNVGAAVLRSIGDSKAPFYYLVLSSCLNIVLDIVFVAVVRIGVAGVAIATVISQLISVVLCLRRMTKMDALYRFRLDHLKINWHTLYEVIDLGLPAGLQTSITALSALYLQRYINSFSPAAIAGIGSAMKIDQFAGMPCQAIGLAMTTFISQNLGAGQPERARKGVRISCIAVALLVAILGVPIYFLAPKVVAVFGPDPEMITYGVGMLHIIMPVYLTMGLLHLFGGVIRGYGWSKSTMVISLGGMVVVRQIWLAISLSRDHVIRNIYLGYPIGWIASLIPLLILYYYVVNRQKEPNIQPPSKEGV